VRGLILQDRKLYLVVGTNIITSVVSKIEGLMILKYMKY